MLGEGEHDLSPGDDVTVRGDIGWVRDLLEAPAGSAGTVGGLLSDHFAYFYRISDPSITAKWSDLTAEIVVSAASRLGIPEGGVYAALWEGSSAFDLMAGTPLPFPSGAIGELGLPGRFPYRVYLAESQRDLTDLLVGFESHGQRSCPDIWWSSAGDWVAVSSHDLDGTYAASASEVSTRDASVATFALVDASERLKPSS